MKFSEWRFYGFVAACLIGAAVVLILLIGGEVAGPQVAELPTTILGTMNESDFDVSFWTAWQSQNRCRVYSSDRRQIQFEVGHSRSAGGREDVPAG